MILLHYVLFSAPFCGTKEHVLWNKIKYKEEISKADLHGVNPNAKDYFVDKHGQKSVSL